MFTEHAAVLHGGAGEKSRTGAQSTSVANLQTVEREVAARVDVRHYGAVV